MPTIKPIIPITRKFTVGISLFTGLLLFIFLTPLIAQKDPNAINLMQIEQPPSPEHLFGTDSLGRDILARTAAGGKISLAVGIAATSIRTLIAVLLGFAAGFSKKADAVLMRIIDVLLCFPFYVLALSVMVFLGNSLENLIMVIAFFTFAPSARLIRTEVLAIKDREFIQICRINGENSIRMLFGHIVPLLRNTIAVIFTTSVAQAVLMESSLSFLGMGIQEPQASWGAMLSVTLDVMNIGSKWYIWLPAGLCIILMTYSVHLIGEGITSAANREGVRDLS
ncbi:MAG: ABC transporter permease [Treponema sp.]|uniref:ABC transporter permease n=1 Tax=Treponema sp. TaxID=166 RepID=UPI003FA33BE5